MSNSYNDLVAKANFATRAYHMGLPVMEDSEYDAIILEVKRLEEITKIIASDSPSTRVGIKENNFSIKRKSKMLSLCPFYKKHDIISFILAQNDHNLSVEPKIDGIAACLIYENGKLISASTRGDGWEGKDIIRAVNLIDTIPKFISNTNRLEVHGELFIKRVDFKRISSSQKKSLSNSRNLTASSVRLKNDSEIRNRNLQFFAHGIGANDLKELTYSGILKRLSELSIPVISHEILTPHNSLSAVMRIELEASDFEYDTDGVVVKIDSMEERQRLGDNGVIPLYAAAYKFLGDVKEAKILSIDDKNVYISPIIINGCKLNKIHKQLIDDHILSNLKYGITVNIYLKGGVSPSILNIN